MNSAISWCSGDPGLSTYLGTDAALLGYIPMWSTVALHLTVSTAMLMDEKQYISIVIRQMYVYNRLHPRENATVLLVSDLTHLQCNHNVFIIEWTRVYLYFQWHCMRDCSQFNFDALFLRYSKVFYSWVTLFHLSNVLLLRIVGSFCVPFLCSMILREGGDVLN